jgi:hypothetical protein
MYFRWNCAVFWGRTHVLPPPRYLRPLDVCPTGISFKGDRKRGIDPNMIWLAHAGRSGNGYPERPLNRESPDRLP